MKTDVRPIQSWFTKSSPRSQTVKRISIHFTIFVFTSFLAIFTPDLASKVKVKVIFSFPGIALIKPLMRISRDFVVKALYACLQLLLWLSFNAGMQSQPGVPNCPPTLRG